MITTANKIENTKAKKNKNPKHSSSPSWACDSHQQRKHDPSQMVRE